MNFELEPAVLISILALAVTLSNAVYQAISGSIRHRIARERELFEWAKSVAELVAKLFETSPSEPEWKLLRARLSASIDLGRLLVPNDRTFAYIGRIECGYRSEILDPLVAIYRDEERENAEIWTDKHWQAFISALSKQFTPVKLNTAPESER